MLNSANFRDRGKSVALHLMAHHPMVIVSKFRKNIKMYEFLKFQDILGPPIFRFTKRQIPFSTFQIPQNSVISLKKIFNKSMEKEKNLFLKKSQKMQNSAIPWQIPWSREASFIVLSLLWHRRVLYYIVYYYSVFNFKGTINTEFYKNPFFYVKNAEFREFPRSRKIGGPTSDGPPPNGHCVQVS